MSSESPFAREEVEAAFRRYWTIGALNEDWERWPDIFTEDVLYVERIYGTMRGRDAVRAWIRKLMINNHHVHAVLDWYLIDGHRVVINMLNRYYNPAPGGEPLDFAGITVLHYAGDGLFNYEEDYWDLRAAKKAYRDFQELLAEHGEAGIEETPERRALRDPWR